MNLELDIVGVLLDLHTLSVLPPGLQEEVLDLLDLTGHLLKLQQFLNRDHATDQVDTGQNSGTKSFSSLKLPASIILAHCIKMEPFLIMTSSTGRSLWSTST